MICLWLQPRSCRCVSAGGIGTRENPSKYPLLFLFLYLLFLASLLLVSLTRIRYTAPFDLYPHVQRRPGLFLTLLPGDDHGLEAALEGASWKNTKGVSGAVAQPGQRRHPEAARGAGQRHAPAQRRYGGRRDPPRPPYRRWAGSWR